MKPKLLLSINRIGSFHIKPEQFCGPQCGSTAMTDYEYRVKIEAYDTRLIEPEMFVLNNEHVTEYFDKKYHQERCTVLSCEVIAQDAICYFLALFVGPEAKYRFIDVQRIKVWIRGAEVSFITGEWKKEDMPKFFVTGGAVDLIKEMESYHYTPRSDQFEGFDMRLLNKGYPTVCPKCTREYCNCAERNQDTGAWEPLNLSGECRHWEHRNCDDTACVCRCHKK